MRTAGSPQQQYLPALCWSMAHAKARPATPYYGAVTRVVQDAVSTRSDHASDTDGAVDREGLEDRLADALRGP